MNNTATAPQSQQREARIPNVNPQILATFFDLQSLVHRAPLSSDERSKAIGQLNNTLLYIEEAEKVVREQAQEIGNLKEELVKLRPSKDAPQPPPAS